jgi:hypothetical protein
MLLAIESCTHKQSLVSMINPFELVAFILHDPPPPHLFISHIHAGKNFTEISRVKRAAIVLWCSREGRGTGVERRGFRRFQVSG